MSTVKEARENKRNFLTHARLTNFKSIVDTEIDFKPGLNIIIGKNGSGKTNFLTGVNNFINFNYTNTLDSECSVELKINKSRFLISHSIVGNKFSEQFVDYDRYRYISSLKINDKSIKVSHNDAQMHLIGKYSILSNLVNHGIPYRKSGIIESPVSFTAITNGKASRELMNFNTEDTLFLRRILWEFLHTVFLTKVRKETNDKLLKKAIIDYFENGLVDINIHLNNFTPIKSIRLNPNFNIINDLETKKILLSNFYFDYNINNNWYTFDLLSDGTKRLFYLISEILSVDEPEKDTVDITFLEEPELGIHPHQLHKLMQFIKEQSKGKQIILTTHSPQVLDVLGPDELDRVIICSYDQQKGTQFNALTEVQIKKAQKYMTNDGFLSEYWRFSDLEPAS